MERRNLFPIAVCDTGDKVYLVDSTGRIPALFRVEKGGAETDFLELINKDGIEKSPLQIVGTAFWRGKVFFIPRFSENCHFIIVLNCEREFLEYIDLDRKFFDPSEKYASLLQIDNGLWLFPNDFRKDPARLDLDTFQLSVCRAWGEEARRITKSLDGFLKTGDAVVTDGCVYTPMVDRGCVLSMTLDQGMIRSYQIDEESRLSHPVELFQGDFLFLRKKNEGLVRWHPQEGLKDVLSLEKYVNENHPEFHGWFHAIFLGKRYIWLLPKNDTVLLRIPFQGGKIESILIPGEYCFNKYGIQDYYIKKGMNHVDIYPLGQSWYFSLDLKKDQISEVHSPYKLPSDWLDARYIWYFGRHSIYEHRKQDLPLFLETLSFEALSKASDHESLRGETIWEISR